MIEGFAKEMKLGTKESHSMAESTSFVKKFLGGVVEEENYRTLVANFYFVSGTILTGPDSILIV